MPTMNAVKVGMVGSSIQTRDFVAGKTTEQMIKAAGFNPEGFDVICNGSKLTDLSRPAVAGDMIILSRQVKGNALGLSFATVVLTTPDGDTQDQLVDPAENPTVATILDQAGILLEEDQIVFDGEGNWLDLDSPVTDGMELTVGEKPEIPSPAEITAVETEEFPAEPVVEVSAAPISPAAPAVTGTDPVVLKNEASDFAANAMENRAQAIRLINEAEELEAKSRACGARAAEIENALAAFAAAKTGLLNLGLSIPKEPEPTAPEPQVPFFRTLLENANFIALRVVAKALGVKSSSSKTTTIARLMGEK